MLPLTKGHLSNNMEYDTIGKQKGCPCYSGTTAHVYWDV